MPDQKMEYQVAVESFDAADKAYKQYETLLSSGNVILMLLDGQDLATLDPNKLVMQYQLVWEKMKELLEDRNVKLKAAKDALRQAVVLTNTQWRGPEGKPTTLELGDFFVTSVTGRGFDAESLLNLLKTKHPEKMQELAARTKTTKEGKTLHVIRAEWAVEYEDVMSFLTANGLKDVIDGAYDEIEKTPQVKGPKALAMLGEKKE